jgi:hypothetical protein
MSNATTIQELNRQLADEIDAEARRDPQSPYAGKLVGIANGKVAVVTDGWDDLARRLREIEPDAQKTFALKAGAERGQVVEIWGIR